MTLRPAGGQGPSTSLRQSLRFHCLSPSRKGYAATLPRRPAAVVVVTSHWETSTPTVSVGARPDLLFDYGGFPPETYRYRCSLLL